MVEGAKENNTYNHLYCALSEMKLAKFGWELWNC